MSSVIVLLTNNRTESNRISFFTGESPITGAQVRLSETPSYRVVRAQREGVTEAKSDEILQVNFQHSLGVPFRMHARYDR